MSVYRVYLDLATNSFNASLYHNMVGNSVTDVGQKRTSAHKGVDKLETYSAVSSVRFT